MQLIKFINQLKTLTTMKKLLSIIAIATFAITTQAQTKVEKKLAANLNTIADVTKMLKADYIFIENTATAVPGNTFKFGECMVLTEYADEGINKDAKSIEKDFNKNLGGSTWKFGEENNYSVATVQVTAMGKTDQGNFATSGGMFKVTDLIQGLDIQSGLYQSKKDKNTYMIMFAVRTGMACFADFTKQAAGSSKVDAKSKVTDAAASATPSATDIIPANVPKANDLKNKAKSKLLNKVKL